MLTIGESFNQYRDFLLSVIDTDRDLIGTLQKSKLYKEAPELTKETIGLLRDNIKRTWQELKDLQKWFKASGLEPDEPFTYKKEGKDEGK